jgi:hypothetical protein
MPLAGNRRPAPGRDRLIGQQRLEQSVPERALLGLGGGDVRRRDEAAVVDGGDRDVGDPGRLQLIGGERAVTGRTGVAEDGQEALELGRLHVLLDPQQAAVPAVQRARERPHVGGLELLAAADQAVVRDPEHEGARGGQGCPEPGMGGGERRGSRRVARGIGGQIPPRRHQRRHHFEQCGRGTRCWHVWDRV